MGDESGQTQLSGNGTGRHQMVYKCAWSSRFDLAAFLLGYPPGPEYVGTPRPPHVYPGLPILRCLDVDVKGIGAHRTPSDPSAADLTFDFAQVTAFYGPSPYVVGPGDTPPPEYEGIPPFSRITTSTSQEFVAAGRNQYRFQVSGEPVPHPIAKIVTIKSFHVNLTRVAAYNPAILDAALSKINSSPFLGIQPGFLLFTGYETDRTRTENGLFSPLQMTLTFAHRSYGWNYVFKPNAGFSLVTPSIYDAYPFIDIFNAIQV